MFVIIAKWPWSRALDSADWIASPAVFVIFDFLNHVELHLSDQSHFPPQLVLMAIASKKKKVILRWGGGQYGMEWVKMSNFN